MKFNLKNNPLIILLCLIVLFSCKKEAIINGGNGLSDWTESTHGYGATPNYDIVFNQNEVQRLDIVIGADYWSAMQNDIASIYNSVSSGPPGQGGGANTEETPMYIPCQMYHNGKQWYDVGIRYKGNSSLKNSFLEGNGKLPFRIEMNHFENENPNISGQTFHGFTQLSLSSNFKDESLLHEKLANDVYREFGIPAPQTAFYRIYVDFGEGSIYFGLYTMVEVVFDTPMLNTQFGNANGNCYKPDGDGCKMNDITAISGTTFPNKTNEGGSLSDINELVNSLLASNRLSEPQVWRDNLDAILDTDHFLKWLAANTTMKNWDTYGKMTHNFYLYNNPSSNLLTWIPWDNNEAFAEPTGGPGGNTSLDFDFSNLETTPLGPNGDVAWPLIYYLYNDPVYRVKYDNYIDEFTSAVFTLSNMTNKFNSAHSMIAPYVTGSDGEISNYTHLSSPSAFDISASSLISSVSTRIIEAQNYTP